MKPTHTTNRSPSLLTSSLVALTWVLVPASANAACKSIPYTLMKDDPNTSEVEVDPDKTFSKLVSDDDNFTDSGFADWGLYYWDRFGFQSSEGWKRENYGFDNYGDPTKPLGRTLNGIYALHHSYPEKSSWNDLSGTPLEWMYGYVAGGYNGLDDLRAGTCSEEYAARSHTPVIGDNYIILYQNFFQADVIFRAGTLVHENWHNRQDMSHTAGDGADKYYYYDYMIPSSCSGRVCTPAKLNPKPTRVAVYAIEAVWYLDYYLKAKLNTNTMVKKWALAKFKSRIKNKIEVQDSVPADIRKYL